MPVIVVKQLLQTCWSLLLMLQGFMQHSIHVLCYLLALVGRKSICVLHQSRYDCIGFIPNFNAKELHIHVGVFITFFCLGYQSHMAVNERSLFKSVAS